MDLLALDGRISVITFHSLEDRLTKQLFKEASTVEVPKVLPFIPDDLKPKMELVNRKPICQVMKSLRIIIDPIQQNYGLLEKYTSKRN